MKQIIDEKDCAIQYVFEDHEKEEADEFCKETSLFIAHEYVIDKITKGISSAFYEDIKSRKLVKSEPNSLEVDVLEIAIGSCVDIVLKMESVQRKNWGKIYDLGLPEGEWRFDRNTRVFTLKKD